MERDRGPCCTLASAIYLKYLAKLLPYEKLLWTSKRSPKRPKELGQIIKLFGDTCR